MWCDGNSGFLNPKTVVFGETPSRSPWWLWLWSGSASPCIALCLCIIHVRCEFCFLNTCRWVLLLCAHDRTDYICFIYCLCVYAPVFGCAPEPRHPAAYLQMGGRDGWRLSRGVWASSSGHLITAPAPAACLCLPQPLCLGASFLPESDDAHRSSPKCRSQEGPTLAQSTVVSD